MSAKKFKVNDRVKRTQNNSGGCIGVVKEIKTETVNSRNPESANWLMINVLWDNGTYSSVTPESLEIADK